ncbi:hypothetical protein Lste_3114 [Legionella steelei]|uniref:Endonuclease/Exonuclease/phosphatase family protein n=1 Tax=Legionella steelei TaxID=947033 RepID=A0A0W0ZCI3_9GAMM|nr:hypothetical protein Lste_3114 [Legionella steelei]
MKHSLNREDADTFRFGLVLNGISDHFPIQITAKCSNNQSYSVFSWNLLADVHLYNDFKDISESHFFEETISKLSTDNIYFNERANDLFYFFSELGQYLYTKCVKNTIVINRQLLDDFVSLDQQMSKLSWSANQVIAKNRRQQIEKSRKLIIELMKDTMHPYAHKFQSAIKHCIELIHQIQNPNGVLRWESRFKLIKHNKSLIQQMIRDDFICLQECTTPEDIYNLLIAQGKSSKMLVYSINKNTNDHCVLLYDDTQFKLVGDPIYHALDDKKPCIFAQFKHVITNHKVIIASIHHPGGNHDYVNELFNQINQLRVRDFSEADYMVIGDYNHTKDFFSQHGLKYPIYYPSKCTMAGKDFGNINHAIDAVITNLDKKSIKVTVIEGLPVSHPIHCPVNIIFQLEPQ